MVRYMHAEINEATVFIHHSIADSAYKIWWFTSGANQIPYISNIYISHTSACTLLLSSWVYRVSLFYLVCVLFKLECYLQILWLEDFAKVFEKQADVGLILMEHLAIRTLKIISHKFCAFILSTLILVTVSQFASLLVTTETGSLANISAAGELALCSVTLVSGLLICLRSAAKITHKAQSVTSLAAKWHKCATIDSFDDVGPTEDTPLVTYQIALITTSTRIWILIWMKQKKTSWIILKWFPSIGR